VENAMEEATRNISAIFKRQKQQREPEQQVEAHLQKIIYAGILNVNK
jgi:hypothetical protein